METHRQHYADETEEVYAEWIEEQNEENENSNSDISNDGDGLSIRQRWYKFVKKWVQIIDTHAS